MAPADHPEDVLPEGFVDALLTRKEASDYLAEIGIRRKPATLAKLFCIGGDGPPCRHDGRKPLYPKALLHEWGVRQLTQLRRSSRDARHAGATDQSPIEQRV